jgi:CzcA family heavy metal efflux pump
MLDSIIAFSLRNRVLVLVVALIAAVVGGYQAYQLPIDVFPDLNKPTVTILTEAPSLTAPEDVELQVTRLIERELNGATGVQRIRSSSVVGLSIVWVEFDWGSDNYRNRQIVTEKLQNLRKRLPKDSEPELAPISSIMGEILLIGLRSKEGMTSPMQLRTLGEFTVRPRLQRLPGVAQVNVIGGVLQQYQILTTPERLANAGVTLDQLVDAAGKADDAGSGGILDRADGRESVVRITSRIHSVKDIEDVPVLTRGKQPVRIKDVADVTIGGRQPRRGDACLWVKPSEGDHVGGSAVNITVQKQPKADTVALTREIDKALDEIEADLPDDVGLERHLFRQSDFIEAAIHNVEEAIRDGAFWVFVILLIFLWNLRATCITLTAIPLSIIVTALVFRFFGVTINTMTLGGIAVAVGELVDDAVVDIENIHRRLRETSPARLAGPTLAGFNADNADPRLGVVYEASREVRNSIVYATMIVCLSAVPLFTLGGLEGRMFAPLGLAYVTSLAASLLVSLTVTPALASFLLTGNGKRTTGDPLVLQILKRIDAPIVRFGLRHPWPILAGVGVLACLSLAALLGMGGEFLPPFNEGTLTLNTYVQPGTNIEESRRIGERVEAMVLKVPEVVSVARRTGRAEQDEHAEGVHSSEFDIRLAPPHQPNPGAFFAVLRAVPGVHRWGYTEAGRPREEILADIRSRVSKLGIDYNLGQPISHRLDHVLSGVRAQIAVKIIGPDPKALPKLAHDVKHHLEGIPGVVDLQAEPQVPISEVRLTPNRERAESLGLTPGDVVRYLEAALDGRTVGEVRDGEKRFDVVVRFENPSRGLDALRTSRLKTPVGPEISLADVVDVADSSGPNVVNKENLEPRIVVSCNVRGRDLAGVVRDVQAALRPVEKELREQGDGYRIEYGGQFEAQQQANRRLLWTGLLALAGVFLLLCKALESWRAALQVLVNVPLAAFGSVVALLIFNRPEWAELAAAPWYQWPLVWLRESSLSVAHWVGFLTLIGIVSRNGIMMISHYIHLMRHEAEAFGEAMIVRGTLERLAPVLMTASVAVMGLLPLALSAGETGKEILQPLAVVVIGGLAVSTVLDQLVTPALFSMFGRPVAGAGKAS